MIARGRAAGTDCASDAVRVRGWSESVALCVFVAGGKVWPTRTSIGNKITLALQVLVEHQSICDYLGQLLRQWLCMLTCRLEPAEVMV